MGAQVWIQINEGHLENGGEEGSEENSGNDSDDSSNSAKCYSANEGESDFE